MFKRLTIKPDYPKHTNIKELDAKIAEGVAMGYNRYTSRPYDEQEPLLKDLNQCVEYRKTIEFFIKTKGLHNYFEHNGGSLEKAMANANRSMDEKQKDGRDYTYSELGRLIDKLTALSENINL